MFDSQNGDSGMLGAKMIVFLLAAIALLAVLALAIMAGSLPRSGKQVQTQQAPTAQNFATGPKTTKNNEQKSDEGPQIQEAKNYWERFVGFVESREKLVTAFSAILMVVITGAVALSTYFLYDSTKNLVIGAQDTAARELRAYVYVNITSFRWPDEVRDESGKIIQRPDRYGIVLNVVNGGKTWARNLIIRKMHAPKTGDDDSWSAIKWDEIAEKPLVLGPGQQFKLQFGDVLFSDLPNIVSGSEGIHYYAWITYDDAFNAPRQTQIAMRINADVKGYISFSYLPPHNCADDDCPK